MKTAIIKKAGSYRQPAVSKRKEIARCAVRNPQSGYTLVSLMAMMTLLAIAMMAVAPSVYQQVQRDRELEAIRRGEEVAEAIRQYVNHYQGAKFPNSIDDLLEGIPYGTKKRQILRESAAIDPLSEDGKWGLVPLESKTMRNFTRRVQNYNNGALPTSENVHRTILNRLGVLITNTDTKNPDDNTESADVTDDGDEITTGNTPFIGVVSQSKNKSFIAYYGIENHSKWIFTPLFRGGGSTPVSNTQNTRDRSRRTEERTEQGP
jgi:type II secretory pathway pseudopilin PulG